VSDSSQVILGAWIALVEICDMVSWSYSHEQAHGGMRPNGLSPHVS
jgi:hypothetical protein